MDNDIFVWYCSLHEQMLTLLNLYAIDVKMCISSIIVDYCCWTHNNCKSWLLHDCSGKRRTLKQVRSAGAVSKDMLTGILCGLLLRLGNLADVTKRSDIL
jgi:hypothetical protein